MQGDASLFARSDGIEAAWKLMDPVIRESERGMPLLYTPGGQGPPAADALPGQAGHVWDTGCGGD